MSPFDFLNAINDNKQNLFEDPQAEKDYSSFMINRGLSYFPDTILYANEMNRNHGISKQWQFDFLRLAIKQKKRFSKWHKKDAQSEDIKLVCKYYKYSEQKAYEIIDMLPPELIQELRTKFETGGRNP